MKKSVMRWGIALTAATLVLSGCSSKASDNDSESSDGIKVGPGVTDDTITVGALGITSGPAAVIGQGVVDVQRFLVDQVNADGGVCDREIVLEIRDTAYDPQRAVAAYNEIEPNIAALSQLMGSPSTAALIDSLESDEVLTMVGGYGSDLLGYEHIQLNGATFDLLVINGLEWLAEEEGLQEGDKVGHVLLEGEAGASAREGSTFVGEKLGFEIVYTEYAATDTDLSSQVAALKAAGVKAVVFTGLPPAFASFASVAASVGFDVPIIGDHASFVSPLMDSPAGPALEKVRLTSPVPASASTDPGLEKFVADFTAANPDVEPSLSTVFGATMFNMLIAGLEQACEDGDLSRAGITNAFRSISDFDTGFGTTFDLTDPNKAPSQLSYILQPDSGTPGDLKEVEAGFTSDYVQEYLDAK